MRYSGRGPGWRLKVRYMNTFDIKTLVGCVLLQVGTKYMYEYIASNFIALVQVVFLTSAEAVCWFE